MRAASGAQPRIGSPLALAQSACPATRDLLASLIGKLDGTFLAPLRFPLGNCPGRNSDAAGPDLPALPSHGPAPATSPHPLLACRHPAQAPALAPRRAGHSPR